MYRRALPVYERYMSVGLLPVYERYMDDTSYKYKIVPIGGFYIYVLIG